jgi:hypothetical protein
VKARDLNRLADRIRNTDYSINGSCQHQAPEWTTEVAFSGRTAGRTLDWTRTRPASLVPDPHRAASLRAHCFRSDWVLRPQRMGVRNAAADTNLTPLGALELWCWGVAHPDFRQEGGLSRSARAPGAAPRTSLTGQMVGTATCGVALRRGPGSTGRRLCRGTGRMPGRGACVQSPSAASGRGSCLGVSIRARFVRVRAGAGTGSADHQENP